jgi:hypothetical protein
MRPLSSRPSRRGESLLVLKMFVCRSSCGRVPGRPQSYACHGCNRRVEVACAGWEGLISTGTGQIYALSVALTDFNGDGNLDMAVVNQNNNTVTVLSAHLDRWSL